jgi:hypothetical protein
LRKFGSEVYGILSTPLAMRTDGYAATFDATKAQFETAWRQWLAWAKLAER